MPKLNKTAAIPKREKKSSKKKSLDSAGDWLDEAISLEDSGDRWVQDPPKAHRFYLQSLAAYEKCLSLDATCFDAEYNRARLYLQIAQACALLADPCLDVVKKAIVSHRSLAARYPLNSDVKYNLGTVLLYYTELVGEHEILSSQENDSAREEALKEALQALRQCAEAQTAELARIEADQSEAPSMDSDAGTAMADENGEIDLDVTYISHEIVFDTLLALVEAYTQLLGLDSISDSTLLEQAQNFVESVVLPQITALIPQCHSPDVPSRFSEAHHAMLISRLECEYRRGSLTIGDYQANLGQLVTHDSSAALCCINADAFVALADSARTSGLDQGTIWTILTNGASAQIVKALAMSTDMKQKAPAMHITRGDIELYRANVQTVTAEKNRATLCKNASIYYKRAISDCLPKDIRLQNEASLKAAIVDGELSTMTTPSVPQMTTDEARQIVSNARADGLFQGTWRLLDAK